MFREETEQKKLPEVIVVLIVDKYSSFPPMRLLQSLTVLNRSAFPNFLYKLIAIVPDELNQAKYQELAKVSRFLKKKDSMLAFRGDDAEDMTACFKEICKQSVRSEFFGTGEEVIDVFEKVEEAVIKYIGSKAKEMN